MVDDNPPGVLLLLVGSDPSDDDPTTPITLGEVVLDVDGSTIGNGMVISSPGFLFSIGCVVETLNLSTNGKQWQTFLFFNSLPMSYSKIQLLVLLPLVSGNKCFVYMQILVSYL